MADTRMQVAIAFKWFFIQPLSTSRHKRVFPKYFFKAAEHTGDVAIGWQANVNVRRMHVE
jgi:hypothetical protein